MTANTTKPPADEPKQEVAKIAPPKPPLVGGGRIMPIVPTTFESAFRLATIIQGSGMAPKGYMDLGEEKGTRAICVAIMHGMEVGFTPMAALQSIAIINGMPTIWGDGMIGLVEASGLLEDKIETIEYDKDGMPAIAVCRVKRAGRSQWTEQSFTQAEAKIAGLWRKRGPWTEYPRRMMQMRARAWALRDAFPDVLRGLQSAEEARDMVDIGGHSTAPPEPTRDQFRRTTTIDADQLGDGNGNGHTQQTDAGGTEGQTDTGGGHDDVQDWVVPNGTTEQQVDAFDHLISEALTAADVEAIQATNAAITKKWAAGKPGSQHAKALETVNAAIDARLKGFLAA